MAGIVDDNLKTPGPDWHTLPGAVVLYDQAGLVIDANQAACELLGVARDELVGTSAENAGWLIAETPDGPMSVHPVVGAIKSRLPVVGVVARVMRPDGLNIWIQVDAVPQLSKGEVSGVTAAVTDVSHLIARSRMSGRSGGDHIVDAVTDVLAQARLDPQAILANVTRTLSRMRPGIWVAAVMGKDPEAIRVIATEEGDSAISAYVEAMQRSGAVSTTPITSRVIESGEPMLLPSVSFEGLQSLLNEEVRNYIGDHPIGSLATTLGVMVVPMHARGATIGTLGLFERRGSNPLTEKDLIWGQAIADRTGLAVENAQLYEDAVQRLDRLTALQGVSLAMSASPDLRLTLKVILDHVTAQLKVDAADVLLLDETDNQLALSASTGFLATAVLDYRLPVAEGVPGQAMAGRRMETVTALSAFSQFRRRSLFAREGFRSYGAVPLISRGKLLGALEVFHRSVLTPDQEWLSFLDALGSVAAVAIDNAAMQERLRQGRGLNEPRRPLRAAPQMSGVEREILRMAVEGMTNREIAANVHLSQNTVKFHMRQLLQRTGASNRTELAHQAAKEGWI
jgi:PAS domain S-box-containing protein